MRIYLVGKLESSFSKNEKKKGIDASPHGLAYKLDLLKVTGIPVKRSGNSLVDSVNTSTGLPVTQYWKNPVIYT